MRRSIRFLVSLALLIPIGIATKFYHGPGELWIQYHFGGVVYEIFWCLLIACLLRHQSVFRIALSVFLVTCVLECLQLWHPPFLEWIRASFIGRALIGTSFSLLDFPHYFLGCLLGSFWARWARRELISDAASMAAGLQAQDMHPA